MDWKNMKHGGFEEREEIEYYKHPKHYKHLVTHSRWDLRRPLYHLFVTFKEHLSPPLLSQISVEATRRVRWVGFVVVFILVVRNISRCFEGVNKIFDVREILVLWYTKHLNDTLEVVPIECAWWW